MNETLVSVDIEADGPVPGKYSMLSLGACVVDRPETTFYATLRPVTDSFDPDALKVSGLDRGKLDESGDEPGEAMRRFGDWVTESTKGGGPPVFVGFNAPFDWSFVNYYFHRYADGNPFGHSALDIKSYYFAALKKTQWSQAAKINLEPSLASDQPHTHNALDDAVEQADIFRKIRAHIDTHDS